MSISSSLANALTGLKAASRSAQVVSSNVSNALTEGYARREIELSPRVAGGTGAGVRVDGITRIVDETLIRERRLASASLGAAGTLSEFASKSMDLIGEPQEPYSLVGRVAEFQSALLSATSSPDSDNSLAGVLFSAKALANKVNQISDGVQTLRENADAQIGFQVEKLNSALKKIGELNEQILRARGTDQDYPGLLDSRQNLIDEVAEIIPVRQFQRENDTVALYSLNGALLLDPSPAEFGFQETAPILAQMTLQSAALSGLTLNGGPIIVSGDRSAIAGGTLSALFQVRDEVSVEFQSNIDEVARDLVARFEDIQVDPTLVPGAAGLFTDQGNPLDGSNVIGLAGRLEVNVVVDPSQGGDIWRLRDGIGATAPGSVGDATLLQGYLEATESGLPSVGGTFSQVSRSLDTLVSEVTSAAGRNLVRTETLLTFENAKYTGINDAVLAQGVNTDTELQKLLLIEQAYAANAKVIQTIDDLIQSLIRI